MSETTSHPAVIEMRGVQVAAMRDPSLMVLGRRDWSVLAGEFWVVAGSATFRQERSAAACRRPDGPQRGNLPPFWLRHQTNLTKAQIAERLRVGFVFADGQLFHQLTLAENVALPLRYHSNCPPPRRRTSGSAAGIAGTDAVRRRDAGKVPVVWRQRAALARALALQPELLLLDNPNGGLAARHRQWLVDFLDQLWRGHDFFGGRPMTLVVTTDDLQPWRHPQRKFAGVQEGRFSVLGRRGGEEFNRHQAVQELLTETEGQA